MPTFLQRLTGHLRDWLPGWRRRLRAERPAVRETPAGPRAYKRLERVVVTDEVYRTLFDDFERHRRTERGEQEVGWLLMGLREERHAIALAALPAGAERQASQTHIWIAGDAHAPAMRLLRQGNRRLGVIGVVHTHPGSLRHPSGGDYRGDIRWVGQLRGHEGVFGIGTADDDGTGVIIHTEPHQHVRESLCFNWYALARGDSHYRRLPVEVAVGPDLAGPLVPLWPTLEHHAVALERVCTQQAGVVLECLGQASEAMLAMTLPLAGPEERLRVLLQGSQARYYVEEGGALAEVDPAAATLDQGVYLILAELARRHATARSN